MNYNFLDSSTNLTMTLDMSIVSLFPYKSKLFRLLLGFDNTLFNKLVVI